jgi:hypothetical protein
MAMLVAMLLKSEPIYETLKRRTLEQQAAPGGLFAGQKTLLDVL